MAIPIIGIIIGSVKTGIKTSAKKILLDKSLAPTEKALVKKILETKIPDAEAVVLNRLKKISSKEGVKYLEKQWGLQTETTKKIIKAFNQTEKMKKIATGNAFKRVLTKTNRNAGITAPNKIKDALEGLYNNDNKAAESAFNNIVLSYLIQIDFEVNTIINNVVSTDRGKSSIEPIDTSKLFVSNSVYHLNTVRILEKILNNLTMDIERYNKLSSSEVVISDHTGKYQPYNKKDIVAYKNEIIKDVTLALKIKGR